MMNHETCTERLSDYMDGELSAAEADEVAAHLASCDVCRATHAELRTVVELAAAAPATGPERDLWPDLAARLPARNAQGLLTPAQGEGATVTRLSPRRVSFSMPQLAAAAVVLMALSGGVVHLLDRQAAAPELAAGTILQTADAGAPVRLVADSMTAADPALTDEVASLERVLEENRAQLDPATVEVVEQSLQSIDRAIADARTALEADPGNPNLHRHLDSTMRRKADILRLATRGSRGT